MIEFIEKSFIEGNSGKPVVSNDDLQHFREMREQWVAFLMGWA